jgi:hypothetical protein
MTWLWPATDRRLKVTSPNKFCLETQQQHLTCNQQQHPWHRLCNYQLMAEPVPGVLLLVASEVLLLGVTLMPIASLHDALW